MKISKESIVKLNKTLDDMEKVYTAHRLGSVDYDSIRLAVYDSSDNHVADGQYNVRTNWAHITVKDEYDDGGILEGELVDGIESRKIELL